MNEKHICAICGDEHEESAMTQLGNGDWVCNDCRDDDCFQCERCGEWHRMDYCIPVNGDAEYWCGDCADQYAYRCDDCGDYYTEGRLATYGPDLCYSCYESGRWERCAECGEVVPSEDAHWVDDEEDYFCDRCYDRLNENPIRPYSYKPEPEFKRRRGEAETALTFGVELEVDHGDGDRNETAKAVIDCADGRVYCKADGSLDSGFEIVTHPGTLAHHQYEMHWSNITRICRKAGYKSHDAGTCGLHIHVGRAGLGPDLTAQKATIVNLLVMMTKLREALTTFSRRTDTQLARWAAFPAIDLTTPSMATLAEAAWSTRFGGRYQALNLGNSGTIEFRIFRGTLKRDTLVASIQLVSNMVEYAMTHALNECLTATFADIVSVKPHKELVAYSVGRNLISTAVCNPA